MEDAIKFSCSGIKCDNETCGFREDSIKVEDYKEWLEKRCPKCGEILLTKKDYYAVMSLYNIIKFVNKYAKKRNKSKPTNTVNVKLSFNGSGDINIEEVKRV